MKTNLFSVKAHMGTGPGGWYCTCCGPAPKHRKLFSRIHKKQIYRILNKFENSSC